MQASRLVLLAAVPRFCEEFRGIWRKISPILPQLLAILSLAPISSWGDDRTRLGVTLSWGDMSDMPFMVETEKRSAALPLGLKEKTGEKDYCN